MHHSLAKSARFGCSFFSCDESFPLPLVAAVTDRKRDGLFCGCHGADSSLADNQGTQDWRIQLSEKPCNGCIDFQSFLKTEKPCVQLINHVVGGEEFMSSWLAQMNWSTGPCPIPSCHNEPAFMVLVMYILAAFTASVTSIPLARLAVIAAERVQPDPCVLSV